MKLNVGLLLFAKLVRQQIHSNINSNSSLLILQLTLHNKREDEEETERKLLKPIFPFLESWRVESEMNY